jgi:hypothetical protein
VVTWKTLIKYLAWVFAHVLHGYTNMTNMGS